MALLGMGFILRLLLFIGLVLSLANSNLCSDLGLKNSIAV